MKDGAGDDIRIRHLDARAPDFDAGLRRLLAAARPAAEVAATARAIVEDVRRRGDAALMEHTRRLDRHDVAAPAELEIPPQRFRAALEQIPAESRTALEQAAERIRAHHRRQRLESWRYRDEQGVVLGEKVAPLERVGVYVPGGKAAYPSSVLMNVLPARVAGVGQVLMVVPAREGGHDPLVLAAAAIAGVDRGFAVGGAQAVAALAYGTATVPRVDKIVGPGNAYVAAAKQLVYGDVGIDLLAGPSEVLVICDGDADPEWVAMDLCAQAEHDEDARAILISPEESQLQSIRQALQRRLPELERADIIRSALQRHGLTIQVRDLREAVAVANRIAPEHLELAVADPEALLEDVRNAGAIFLGHYSAEVLGDYCAGPNHVLPTGGSARFASPLGVYDFQKRSSLIRCDRASGAFLGGLAALLAHGEGLTAHARAAELRVAGAHRERPEQRPEKGQETSGRD